MPLHPLERTITSTSTTLYMYPFQIDRERVEYACGEKQTSTYVNARA